MDEMVLHTQEWLNSTYGNDPRYNVIEENRETGWATIYALTRAFQIELGIQSTANNFGATSRFYIVKILYKETMANIKNLLLSENTLDKSHLRRICC